MKLQIVKLNTPSKILKGWAEVKEVEGKKVWAFGHDHFEADDSVEVGTFAHVLSSKNDVTKIQIRHLVKVPSTKFKKGQWYNAFKSNNVWKINDKHEVEFPKMFDKFNKLKVVAQEVREDETLLEIISFVDMKRKSGYSILDSTININSMIEHTEFAGALTDKNLLSGLISYYKGMKSQKKHPIVGVTLNVASVDGSHDEKELTFLAKSSIGFKNVGLMSTYAAHNLVKEVPYLSVEDMKKHQKDVVCLIPQETAELTDLLMANDEELAEAYIRRLKAIFDTRLYIAVSKHDEESNEMAALRLQKFAKKHKVQVVIGSDSHMINREDEDNHDVLRCIGLGTTTDDQNRPRYDGDFYHLLGQEEALEVYGEELMWNTLNLAESLDVKIQFGVNYLPKFPIPEGFTSESYFKHLCLEGYNFRFGDTEKDTEEYRERLDFEIETILKMDFPDYFLIVADFMRFARDNDIETGPGRGSACGSMVAYVLQITDVDPIEYGLLFERFLNPDRISMPDYELVA